MTDIQNPASLAERHLLPSGLIHEMRTPLNQIIGYSEMLIEQEPVTSRSGSDLQKVLAAGNQLLALINGNFESVRTLDAHPIVDGEPQDKVIKKEIEIRSQEESKYPPQAARGVESAQGLILVVDDIAANRELLASRLELQGYAVTTAENGREALEKLHTDTFDLVLLDIMMPEIDGYEVLKRLKADEKLQHVPVIMISALSELESVAKCIELGADDYLPKPFNPTLLKARISASLEKKRGHDREILLYEKLQENFKRLQELEQVRDDMTHMIVHDLRTPLSSVISGMETLDIMGDLDSGQRELVQIAIDGGEQLLGIINDLLDVEKVESGAMLLDYVLLDAATLVQSAAARVSSLCADKELLLTNQIPPGLPAFQGDEDKLRRVLVNLLGNAIKFTPPKGGITLDAHFSESDHAVIFSVKESGEGIPAEDIERIFEKFGQVASRQGGRTMSTGLGLTFCKLTVEAHGGTIHVESAPGEGSIFSFTIPIRPVSRV